MPNWGADVPERPGSATPSPGRRSGFVVLIVLGGLVALGPLSTDAYVPGLPRLAADLGSSTALAQFTITSCLIGLAAGQLLAGPLSDVLGRRVPLLFGITLYTVAGLLCAGAPNVLALIALRGVQGVGGAFALVIAYACVRDRNSGPAAARYFATLLLVTGLAPVLAPLGGGQILAIWSWRGVFVVLAALSALLLFAVAVALPESLPPARRSAGGLRVAGLTYRRLLADRQLVGYVLVNGLAFAAMFAYISGSPFVLQTLFGLSPREYSVVFAVNAAGLVLAAQVSGRLVERVGARALLTAGVVGVSLGGVLALVVATTVSELGLLLPSLFLAVTSVGLVLPNAAALSLQHHGPTAGSAAALLGFVQFFLGGAAAPLVGLVDVASAVPMAAVMAGLGTTAYLVLHLIPSPAGQPALGRTTVDPPEE